jgi:transposase
MGIKEDVEFLVGSGMSVEKIADKCRVSGVTVYRWLKGRHVPDQLHVDKVNLMASRARRLFEKEK